MKNRKLITLLLTVVMVVMASANAFAVGLIDTDRDVTLTLNYKDGETILDGATFNLYKVAEVSPGVDFSISSQFAPYADKISMDGLDKDGWDALALTLAGFIAQDELQPLATGETDENGQLVFPAETGLMKPGMYLVIGEQHRQGAYYYTPIPTMVFLPKNDYDKNAWDYNETINPKPGKKPVPIGNETTNLKALKVWDDEGKDAARPESISVNLIKDGKVVRTDKLSEDNNWRVEWFGLSTASTWQVTEDVPEGYTVKIEQEGITFVITNTAKEPVPPVKPGDEPEEDIEDEDVPLTEGDIPETEEYEEMPEDPVPLAELPQTGLLWWPVAVMAAAGLLFLVLGVYRRRSC